MPRGAVHIRGFARAFGPRARLAVVASVFVGMFAAPAAAFGNGPLDAAAWQGSAGEVTSTIPADGHLTVAVPAIAGDWVLAYSRDPDTHAPKTGLRLLPPGVTDAADSGVAAAGASGVLAHRASVDGTYHAVFEGPAGAVIERGLFRSRPNLAIAPTRTRVVAYGARAVVSATLIDPLYDYVAFDGPRLAFEPILLQRSSDGHTWRSAGTVVTDLNGRAARVVTPLTSATYLRFRYYGALYPSAGFGEAASRTVKIVPRVSLRRSAPRTARAGRSFRVLGSVSPRHSASGNTIIVQARRAGSSQVRTFHSWVRPSRSGPTRLAASLKLGRGRWSVRYYHPADSRNAATVSKWVIVVVR